MYHSQSHPTSILGKRSRRESEDDSSSSTKQSSSGQGCYYDSNSTRADLPDLAASTSPGHYDYEISNSADFSEIDQDVRSARSSPWNPVQCEQLYRGAQTEFIDHLPSQSSKGTSSDESNSGAATHNSICLLERPIYTQQDGSVSFVESDEADATCWNCHFKKIKCKGAPCTPCTKIKNTDHTGNWHLPCDKQNLSKRTELLLPDVLTKQTSSKSIVAFIKAHVEDQTADENKNTRQLSLAIGLGDVVRITVIEVRSKPNDTTILTQPAGVVDAQTGMSSLASIFSLPLMPMTTERRDIENLINPWINDFLGKPYHDLSDKLSGALFPRHEAVNLTSAPEFQSTSDDDDIIWLQEVFRACFVSLLEKSSLKEHHFRTRGLAYDTVHLALRLLVLVYIMGQAYHVPRDCMHEVKQLTKKVYGCEAGENDFVGSRLVNKVLKAVICGILQEDMPKLLSNLHQLLRHQAKSKEDNRYWLEICFSILMLVIIVGFIQKALEQRALFGNAQQDDSYTIEMASAEISKLDEQVSGYLTSLFHHKFKTTNKRSGTNPIQGRLPHASDERVKSVGEQLRRVTERNRECHCRWVHLHAY